MELREQLQAHLGEAFRIERELGGGGMSRVFLATEVRLARTVAVKVLSPELAQGLNAERFEREILLAASLQQANIVPVLAAGEVDGLPYFTMPFIDGESLRSRLTGSGLPIADVLAVLRDVAKALAYAHARGIVHRDIKPDNVLLSGGTAVVTDFGIAKALSASRNQAGATLTSVGTSIGTPAYMAPEQIAGDPHLDHRVDLYAFGCMAYELLSGVTPFGDRAPQKMLAAHLSETPSAVTARRGDCPPMLAGLVRQLLEKDPADRPASAAAVLRTLDDVGTSSAPTLAMQGPGRLARMLAVYAGATAAVAIVAKAAVVAIGLPEWTFPGAVGLMLLGLPALLVTGYVKRVASHAATATPTITDGGSIVGRAPSGTLATIALKASPHVTWRRTMRAGMITMSGFVLLVVGFMVTRQLGVGPAASLFATGALAAEDKVLLADFVTQAEDSALAPIVQAAVRAAMSQSRVVQVLSPSDVAGTLGLMQRPTNTPLDPTVSREVATRTGAKAILGGRLARAGSGYLVSLDLTSVAQGTPLASFQGTADGVKDLLGVVDELTRKLRGKMGESLKQVQNSVPLVQATTSNLEALKKFTEATRANDIDGDYDRAVKLSREAVALDSTFALAWRKLAIALGNGAGSSAARDSAALMAFRYADRLPDREKYLAIGLYYQVARTASDRGKQLAAYQAAYAADSNSHVAANQLTTLYEQRRQYDSALHYARRQVVLEQTANSVGWLADIFLSSGQVDSAAQQLDSLRRARPETAEFDGIQAALAMVFQARHQDDSLDLLVRRILASESPSTRMMGLDIRSEQEITAGRLTTAAATDRELRLLLSSRGAEAQIDGLHEATSDIFFRGRSAEGLRVLDGIIAGAQWKAAPATDRPYLDVASLYAMAGRPDRARELVARFDAEDPGAKAPRSRARRDQRLGEIALAEKKFDEALRLFRAAAVAEDGAPVTCGACVEYDLARAFDAAQSADSALAHYLAYLAVPMTRRAGIDGMALAHVEKRLGELYDARNQRDLAIKHYEAFATQWAKADAELQPGVATVRKRIAELRKQGG